MKSLMASRRTFTCITKRALHCRQISPRLPRKSNYRACSSGSNQRDKVSKAVKPEQLEELFATPTWSVESLLPPKKQALDAPKISSKQLHHLLRLSALPPPETLEEEQKMLVTLSAQLHFVGEIQQVDTAGVEPLRAVQDETLEAKSELRITLDTLKEALQKEHVIGKHYKRIQRKAESVEAKDVENWDVLGSAERMAGKYFLVQSERPQE